MTIGYKKCRGNKIVELEILGKNNQHRKVANEDYAQYRCEKAMVIRVYRLNDNREVIRSYRTARSIRDPELIYKINKIVKPDCYDEVGSHGIHYFLSEYAAYHYRYTPNNGLSLRFYCNGSIMSDVWYINGKRQGAERYWKRNGKLQRSCEYKNNFLHGQYRSWYENGILKRSCDYEGSIRHGKCLSWYKNGNIRQFYEYRYGKRHGYYTHCDVNGNIRYIYEYRYGKRHGYYSRYDVNGNVCQHGRYKKGKLDDIFEIHYDYEDL